MPMGAADAVVETLIATVIAEEEHAKNDVCSLVDELVAGALASP